MNKYRESIESIEKFGNSLYDQEKFGAGFYEQSIPNDVAVLDAGADAPSTTSIESFVHEDSTQSLSSYETTPKMIVKKYRLWKTRDGDKIES